MPSAIDCCNSLFSWSRHIVLRLSSKVQLHVRATGSLPGTELKVMVILLPGRSWSDAVTNTRNSWRFCLVVVGSDMYSLRNWITLSSICLRAGLWLDHSGSRLSKTFCRLGEEFCLYRTMSFSVTPLHKSADEVSPHLKLSKCALGAVTHARCPICRKILETRSKNYFKSLELLFNHMMYLDSKKRNINLPQQEVIKWFFLPFAGKSLMKLSLGVYLSSVLSLSMPWELDSLCGIGLWSFWPS